MLHPAQRLISSLNTTELIISVPIAHVIFLDGNYFLGYELSSCPFKLQVFMDVSMIPDTAGPRRLSEFHSMDEYVTILKAVAESCNDDFSSYNYLQDHRS